MKIVLNALAELCHKSSAHGLSKKPMLNAKKKKTVPASAKQASSHVSSTQWLSSETAIQMSPPNATTQYGVSWVFKCLRE